MMLSLRYLLEEMMRKETEFREGIGMCIEEGMHPVMVCFICEKEILGKDLVYIGQGLYKHLGCKIGKYRGYGIG